MTEFDYSPLQRKIKFSEYLRAPGGWIIKLATIAALVLITLGVLLSILMGSVDGFGFLGFMGVGIAALSTIQIGIAHRRIRLSEFAARNNLEYAFNVPYDNRPGIIFEQGDSRTFSEILYAADKPFSEIGNFQYVTGSGKSRQVHLHGFIRIKLPRRLPHMVLDARSNNLFGKLTNLPIGFSADQQLSLEGDFNEHFTLYAPVEYKRDALYVFTPDVMQALIDTANGYDCEVIDDDLYIYPGVRAQITDPVQLEKILKLSQILQREFDDQTDYYADERVGDRSLNLIAPSGARLKTGMSATAIVTAAIVIIYIVFSSYNSFSPFFR
jgi:hypothetical protein